MESKTRDHPLVEQLGSTPSHILSASSSRACTCKVNIVVPRLPAELSTTSAIEPCLRKLGRPESIAFQVVEPESDSTLEQSFSQTNESRAILSYPLAHFVVATTKRQGEIETQSKRAKIGNAPSASQIVYDTPLTKKEKGGSDGFSLPRNDADAKSQEPEPSRKESLRTGWGGKARARNTSRAKIFRLWLQETFGPDYLHSGSGVMEVAGGKGELAVELFLFAGIPCTIVDPRPLNVLGILKHLTSGKVRRLMEESTIDDKGSRSDTFCEALGRVSKEQEEAQCAEPNECNCRGQTFTVTLPLPEHLQCWFAFGESSAGSSTNTQSYRDCVNSSNTGTESEQKLSALMKGCSVAIGMHPDQATEAIVDYALAYNKPFAIVPCCVFPEMFPHRKSPTDGKRVRSFDQFIEYLRHKDAERIQCMELPFVGRNIVLFSLGSFKPNTKSIA